MMPAPDFLLSITNYLEAQAEMSQLINPAVDVALHLQLPKP